MAPPLSRAERLAALQRGDSDALGEPAELVGRARSLLENEDPADAEGLSDLLVELIAFHAAENSRSEFLARAIVGPKSLAKRVKKELYRLQSEGRPLELPKQDDGSAPSTANTEVLSAFLSPVDVDGRRTFVAPHDDARRGFGAFLCEISDIEGVARVELARMPRREYRKFARELSRPRSGEPAWMELKLAELGSFIAAAVSENATRGTLSDAIAQLARTFPGAPTPAASRSWSVGPDELAKAQSSSQLFAESECSRWMPSNDALALLGQRIDEVATSKLVMDEAQRRQQIEAALDRTVAEHFDRAVRERWAERLFRQADYFASTHRRELGELAVATARALAGEAPVGEVPFARVLFQKALLEQTEAALSQLPPEVREKLLAEERAAAEATPKPSEPSGLIVPGR